MTEPSRQVLNLAKMLIGLLMLSGFVAVGYSNCSQVRLAAVERVQLSQATASGTICSDPQTGTQDRYTMIKFGAVNLNARLRDGKILADSDADGIPDLDESARGFSPSNPRSAGGTKLLLDGLCPNQGANSASLCEAPVGCDWVPNKLGLALCDLTSRQGLTDGVDSDKDKIPDLVEILKGTMPNFDDADTDLDHDGKLMWEELDLGRDPESPDSDVPPEKLISFSVTKSVEPIGDCPTQQESWNYSLNKIPLVRTLAVNADDPVSSYVPNIFRHTEDESVIFIYYVVAKLNDDPQNPAPQFLFGQFVPVKYYVPNVNLGAFEKLGIIDGTFRPVQ